MSQPSFMQRLLREKILSRYLTALESGDIDTIIAVLQQSAQDAVLEQMIFDLHESYQTEEELLAAMQKEYPMKNTPDPQEVALESKPLKPLPSRDGERRSRTRWLQMLAAVVLTCLIVGGFAFVQVIHHLGSTTSAGQPSLTWCTGSGAQTSQSLNDSQLTDITAVSPNNVWAVGTRITKTSESFQDVPLVEHWDGAHWSMVPPASPDASFHYVSLKAVSAVSAHDIWAVGSMAPTLNFIGGAITGEQPLLEHWNGTRWTIVSAPDLNPQGDSALVSVEALSATDAWAVGSTAVPTNGGLPLHFTPLALHWNGSRWTQMPLPAGFAPGELNKVTASSPTDVWAVGDALNDQGLAAGAHEFVAHWNGQQWTRVGLSAPYLGYITVHSSDDAWLVGQSLQKKALIEHWNGQRWSVVSGSQPADSSLSSVLVLSPDDVWVAGTTGHNATTSVLIEHWNGTNWSVVSPKAQGGFLYALASVRGKIWAVGAIGPFAANATQQVVGTLLQEC